MAGSALCPLGSSSDRPLAEPTSAQGLDMGLVLPLIGSKRQRGSLTGLLLLYPETSSSAMQNLKVRPHQGYWASVIRLGHTEL